MTYVLGQRPYASGVLTIGHSDRRCKYCIEKTQLEHKGSVVNFMASSGVFCRLACSVVWRLSSSGAACFFRKFFFPRSITPLGQEASQARSLQLLFTAGDKAEGPVARGAARPEARASDKDARPVADEASLLQWATHTCIEASFKLQRLQTADPKLLWVTTDVAGVSSFASSFCY